MKTLHDSHVVALAQYEEEMDAIAWDESCELMNEAEGRWVDNGCSNIENYDYE
jgi:hypothetical protein